MRRSDPDAHGNTTDIEYIDMRNRSDRGLELINEDFWWWLKRNSERVFNDAKTAQDRNTEMTLMWNWWCSTLFTWYPNVIAIDPAGSWPLWSCEPSSSTASPSSSGSVISTPSSGCADRSARHSDGAGELHPIAVSLGGIRVSQLNSALRYHWTIQRLFESSH